MNGYLMMVMLVLAAVGLGKWCIRNKEEKQKVYEEKIKKAELAYKAHVYPGYQMHLTENKSSSLKMGDTENGAEYKMGKQPEIIRAGIHSRAV